MTRAVLVLLLAMTMPVAGQQRPEPQLMLSVFAGLAGGTDLWSVDRQPLLILPTEDLVTPVYDTIRLTRRIRPGFAAGINATYFPSPTFGVMGEISLLGLGLEDNCALIAESPGLDPNLINRQICEDINGRNGAASTVAFFVGALARVAPRAATVPYARIALGFTSRQSATSEMLGRFSAGGTAATRVIYLDPGGGRLDPAAHVGIGLMVPVSPGYQFRIEARDHLLRLREVTGPATLADPGRPPLAGRFVHNLSLVIHFDIVLERKRGRRY